VDPHLHSHSLVLSSMQVMKSGLLFNICSLETSHCQNSDVPDLTTHIEKTILPHLSYDYHFWAENLRASEYDTEILEELRDFFHHHLLYWLKVLSLLKKVNMA
jgi:hypothetical protein